VSVDSRRDSASHRDRKFLTQNQETLPSFRFVEA
jgi:hypothetical protein